MTRRDKLLASTRYRQWRDKPPFRIEIEGGTAVVVGWHENGVHHRFSFHPPEIVVEARLYETVAASFSHYGMPA